MKRTIVRNAHLVELGALAVFAAIAGAGFLVEDRLIALLGAFTIAALLYAIVIVVLLESADDVSLPALAARHDQRAPFILLIGVALDLLGLALVMMLVAGGAADAFSAGLAAASIFAAFILLNTLFAVHYAHVYYVEEGPKPLVFPGDQSRTFSDFLYFSFVLGMTTQVSDVSIVDSGLRRLALAHGIVAFLFNVFVVALAVSALGSIV